MQLNSPQQQAVTSPDPNLLVIAGAGSGKTRVLVERMAFLMRDQGLSPHALMAVTFTNKAAREIRERLEGALGRSLHAMWVGTFHGLAHRFLRAHWRDAGLIEQFLILDSDDQQRMIKRIVADLQLDDAKFKPRAVAGFINGCKDEGQRPQHLQTGRDYYNDTLIRLYADYDARCKTQNLVDFGELLLRTFETLRNKSELLKHYQDRFRHLLIDEFQDTNTIQYTWIRLLAGADTHVMAVGDDDQSIYAWRGARIENIHRYESDFAPVTTIRLEQNYRSTDVILKAANAVISNNTGRLGKELWTDQGAGSPIQLYAAFNEQDEARFVANRISQHVEQGGLNGELAILYRSNAQSRVLEDALLRAGIPYRIYGGQRFYERLEIKNALMYLRLIQNRFDDTAFERVINVPPRGIGERTVEQIRKTARDEGRGLWDSALQLSRTDGLSGRAKSAVAGFIDLINDLDRKAVDLELSDLARDVIEATGLLAYHGSEKGERGQARVDNLNELVSACRAFEPEDQESSILLQFLSQASLDAGETQADPDADAVQLMTLHSAKGLEFPRVFLVGAEEELFPHVMSLDSAGGLEEERRLAYVGITRAMHHLVVTYAESRRLNGRDHFGLLSRFIREIPQECIEEVRLESQIRRPFNSSSFGARPVDRLHRHPRFQEFDDAFGEASGLGIGSRVDHGLFGEGTVLAFEGSGPQMKVQVRFDDESKKWLVLQYAKLVPLG
jgi:DNA helicase-2/ATP-dependent DNA helicase PcrA